MNPAEAIANLLAARRAGQTICPSEAARVVAGSGDWREMMAPVHEAARLLAEQGAVRLTWRGVATSGAAGPYRIGSRR